MVLRVRFLCIRIRLRFGRRDCDKIGIMGIINKLEEKRQIARPGRKGVQDAERIEMEDVDMDAVEEYVRNNGVVGKFGVTIIRDEKGVETGQEITYGGFVVERKRRGG